MAGSTNFLPSREAELVTFSTNFNTRIVASPTTYGLVAGQATAYTTLHNAFVTAYNLASAPNTRTPVNITAKNTAKALLIDGPGGIRALARIVQATPTVTAAQKEDLGLTVRDADPTPIPAPTESPVVDIVATFGNTITVHVHAAKKVKPRGGKPVGVTGAAVFWALGENPPADASGYTFAGNTTKNSFDIMLPGTTPSGSRVWITAFWFNAKMESGPAATPVSVNLPGVTQMAA